MRSANFLAFFLFALLSVLQTTFAEPTPADELVERGTGLDIAATGGDSLQSSLGGGLTLSKSKSEKLVCPAGTGFCSNDPGACCPLGGRCCGNKKCCGAGKWCYGVVLITQKVMDANYRIQTCIPKNTQCCKGGSYCKTGYRCVQNLSGVIRCCPNGKLCLFKGGKQATDANAA
ncbi:hypothetical protein FRC07_014614 [Ceratobasidium sp. 392]|nr:hypothetical protein FRC07_014614 [Ceratobasidium sp. 392]